MSKSYTSARRTDHKRESAKRATPRKSMYHQCHSILNDRATRWRDYGQAQTTRDTTTQGLGTADSHEERGIQLS
jgi:hypothetical protein